MISNFMRNTFSVLCPEIMGTQWKLFLDSMNKIMGTNFLYHNSIGLSKGHAYWYNRFESCQLTFLYKLQQIKV